MFLGCLVFIECAKINPGMAFKQSFPSSIRHEIKFEQTSFQPWVRFPLDQYNVQMKNLHYFFSRKTYLRLYSGV